MANYSDLLNEPPPASGGKYSALLDEPPPPKMRELPYNLRLQRPPDPYVAPDMAKPEPVDLTPWPAPTAQPGLSLGGIKPQPTIPPAASLYAPAIPLNTDHVVPTTMEKDSADLEARHPILGGVHGAVQGIASMIPGGPIAPVETAAPEVFPEVKRGSGSSRFPVIGLGGTPVYEQGQEQSVDMPAATNAILKPIANFIPAVSRSVLPVVAGSVAGPVGMALGGGAGEVAAMAREDAIKNGGEYNLQATEDRLKKPLGLARVAAGAIVPGVGGALSRNAAKTAGAEIAKGVEQSLVQRSALGLSDQVTRQLAAQTTRSALGKMVLKQAAFDMAAVPAWTLTGLAERGVDIRSPQAVKEALWSGGIALLTGMAAQAIGAKGLVEGGYGKGIQEHVDNLNSAGKIPPERSLGYGQSELSSTEIPPARTPAEAGQGMPIQEAPVSPAQVGQRAPAPPVAQAPVPSIAGVPGAAEGPVIPASEQTIAQPMKPPDMHDYFRTVRANITAIKLLNGKYKAIGKEKGGYPIRQVRGQEFSTAKAAIDAAAQAVVDEHIAAEPERQAILSGIDNTPSPVPQGEGPLPGNPASDKTLQKGELPNGEKTVQAQGRQEMLDPDQGPGDTSVSPPASPALRRKFGMKNRAAEPPAGENASQAPIEPTQPAPSATGPEGALPVENQPPALAKGKGKFSKQAKNQSVEIPSDEILNRLPLLELRRRAKEWGIAAGGSADAIRQRAIDLRDKVAPKPDAGQMNYANPSADAKVGEGDYPKNVDDMFGQGENTSEPVSSDDMKLMNQEMEEAKKPEIENAPITDIGEKIGGARKDTATSRGERILKPTNPEKDNQPSWRKRFEVNQIIKSRKPSEEGKWAIHDLRKLDWAGKPRTIGEPFATKEEAESAVILAAVSQKHRVVPSGTNDARTWEIYRDVTDRKRVKVVDQVFPTHDEAMRYMATHAEDILNTKTSFGEEILVKPEKVVRTGAERRKGNATADDFTKSFGFRGVEFGNWNNQAERQEVMNHAYDGLHDLAELLHVPSQAISLNGELGLAFGARGHGLSGARAHYEPDYGVINLTKMQGAGALAHEWFHALDHYLGRLDGKAKSEKIVNQRGDKIYPESAFSSIAVSHGFGFNSKIRAELREAFNNVMETMFRKPKTYIEDTQKAEKFVDHSRKELVDNIQSIRSYLEKEYYPEYKKRGSRPATSEELEQFDALAQKIIDGQDLDTKYRSAKEGLKANARGAMAGRFSNDTLDAISAIIKKVRGRSGFQSENHGVLDTLRGYIERYRNRLAMLKDAREANEKIRKVPTNYAMNARRIDEGRVSNYWTNHEEMAARAFSAYVEDSIESKGNKSDFLSFASDNKYYRHLGMRPYPEAAEREAISKAFGHLFEILDVLPETKTIAPGDKPGAVAKAINRVKESVSDAISPQGIMSRENDLISQFASGLDSIKEIGERIQSFRDTLKRLGGKQFPATTRNSPNASIAMSSMIAARSVGEWKAKQWQGDMSDIATEQDMKPAAFRVLVGATFTEGNLRGIKQDFLDKAEKASAAGNENEAMEFERAAAAVTTTVKDKLLPRIQALSADPKNANFVAQMKKMYDQSPFATEADYQAALKSKAVLAATEYHKAQPEPFLEGNYKASAKIGDDEESPKRNRDLDIHVSLMPNMEEPQRRLFGLLRGGNIRNTLEKHSILEKSAKGSGAYDLDINNIYQNAVNKGMLPGAHAKAIAAMVKSGLAVVGSRGPAPEMDGKPTVGFPLKFQRRQIILTTPEGTKSFGQNDDQMLYVRADVANEWRKALNIDQSEKVIPHILTTIQLLSGVEAISHVANAATILIQHEIGGGTLPVLAGRVHPVFGRAVQKAENFPLLKAAGIVDVISTNIVKRIFNDPRYAERMAELASLGADQPGHGKMARYNPMRITGPLVKAITDGARLAMMDGYSELVKSGLVPDKQSNQRDYINQLGQYYAPGQASAVRIGRSSGLAPFATAGSNMYAVMLRMAQGFKPGYETTGAKENATIRFKSLAQVAAALSIALLWNYLRKGEMNPKGIPLGARWTGTDKDGKPTYDDSIAELTGWRRMTRVTGLDAMIEGSRLGRSGNDISDRAIRQATSAATSPYFGIGPTIATEVLTGVNPHGGYRIPGGGPGKNTANIKEAGKDLNPTLSAWAEDGGFGYSQLGKFAPRKGQSPADMAKIRAQGEDVSQDARDLSSLHAKLSAKADTRTPKEESDFNILSNFYSHRMGPREHDGDVPPTAGYIEIRAALKALEDKATEAEQKGNKFALGRIRAKIEGWKGLLQKEADIARAKLDGPPEAVNPMSAFKRKMMQRRRAMKMSNAIGEGEE